MLSGLSVLVSIPSVTDIKVGLLICLRIVVMDAMQHTVYRYRIQTVATNDLSFTMNSNGHFAELERRIIRPHRSRPTMSTRPIITDGAAWSVCRSDTVVSLQKQLNRSRCRLGCGFAWVQGSMYLGCASAQPGEYDWIIRMRRWLSPMSNYFDHLL